MTATTTSTTAGKQAPKKKRRRPTDVQRDVLRKLSTDDLVAKALEALHALNRRAKEIRDRQRQYRRASFAAALGEQIEDIYAVKTRYLNALVQAQRATVETFTERIDRVGGWYCPACDREWGGWDSACYRCGCLGDPQASEGDDTWYIVQAGGFRFHQPGDTATQAMRKAAKPITPHDPTQPQREIPNVGLTIEAQFAAVRLATRRLKRALRREKAKVKAEAKVKADAQVKAEVKDKPLGERNSPRPSRAQALHAQAAGRQEAEGRAMPQPSTRCCAGEPT